MSGLGGLNRPNQALSPSLDKPLACPQCSRNFSRPSHLDRHRLTHLPASHKNLIPCPRCDRTFSRRDVLLRHMRATHHAGPTSTGSAQKSCFRCVAKKLKCERTRPCRACAASNSSCEYTSSPASPPDFSMDDDSSMGSMSGAGSGSHGVVDGPSAPATKPNHMSDSHGVQYRADHFGNATAADGRGGGGGGGDGGNFACSSVAPEGLLHPALRTPASTSGESPFSSGASASASASHEQPSQQAGPASDTASASAIDPAMALSPSCFGVQQPFAAVFPNVGDDTSFSPAYFALTQPDFRTSGLDWLGFDMPDSVFDIDSQQDPSAADPSMPFASAGRIFMQQQQQQHHQQEQQQRQQRQQHQQNQQHQHQQNEQHQKQPDVDRLVSPSHHTQNPAGPGGAGTQTARNSPTLRPMEPQQASQPWPFDQAHDTIPHRYILPPLREVLQSTRRMSHAGQSDQDTRIDGLVQLLSEQRLPSFGLIQGSGVAAAFGDFQRLLDLYFARFHDIQAIIHKPTWNMGSCPTVLLTAMACLGALLSDDSRDAELSSALSDLCMPMIIWLGASDGTNYSDISYLNALCLHQIYSLGSGNRQLYQNADRSRGTLIGSLRGLGLLSSSWSTGSSGSDDDTVPEPTASSSSTTTAAAAAAPGDNQSPLAREWAAWISREQERRAAWAAFEYDCSLCTLTSRRGAVDLGELPRRLPCVEALWNASSAQAWLALASRLDRGSFSPSLSAVLKTALAPGGNDGGTAVGEDGTPHHQQLTLGSWAKRLCAQVVGRLLWDLKQLEVVAMPEHLGLASLLNAHKESKRELLGALRNLLTLTADPSSTSELITYNITGLLCHYSHLYAAEDVMDVIIYMVRGIMSPDPRQARSLDVARKRLRSTFARDPRGRRTLVWHAAQMVAIANEYIVSAPCEIMRLFMGYVFILAFSAYGPKSSERDPGGRGRGYGVDVETEAAPVRLDLPDHRPQQKRVIAEWIRLGGPAGVGSVGDICADGCLPAISRDAQNIMQKLRCWGLAEKFTKILYIIGAKGL